MKKSIFTILITIVFSSLTFSQLSVKVGGGLGYVTPSGDYSGNTTEFYNGTKYGLSSGFNLHLKAKVEVLSISLKGELDYSSFSNDGNATSTQDKVELSHKILSLRVGPEFKINIPMVPITPYVDANVAFNTISGEVSFQGVQRVPSRTYEIPSESRIGFGFGGGVEISLGPVMTLDAGIHYNLVNPIGKEYKSVPSFDRVDAYTSLNDEKDPLYNSSDDKTVVANARSINNLQFTLSVLFGF
ncbi:MAG: porin family protein [Ignavibacteriales bacterium]|nr:MAG: porin family protein [Ignavibacteriales bacterium]